MSSQSLQINQLEGRLAEMVVKKVRAAELFDRNELYDTFARLVGERDEVIKKLVAKIT